MAEGFSAVTKQMFEDRKVEQAEFKAQKEVLEEMKVQLEESGQKAEDNKEYNKQNAALQKKMLASRLKGADSPSARKEIKQEQKAEAKKNQNLLGKIAGGVTGMFGSMKDAAAKKISGAGKGLINMLKGAAIAGLLLAVVAFLNSEHWQNLKNFIVDKVVPALKAIWEWLTLLFSDPVQALKDLFSGLLEGAKNIGIWIWNRVIKPFWGWLKGAFTLPNLEALWDALIVGYATFLDIFWWPVKKAIAWILEKFGWDEAAAAVETFSIKTFVMGIFDTIKKWIKGIFSWGKAAGATEEGGWSLTTMIDTAFQLVKDWVKGIFTWGKAAGATEEGGWSLANMIDEAFLLAKKWVISLFTWATDPVDEKDSFLKKTVHDAVALVQKWALSLFAWSSEENPDDPWLTTKVKDAINTIKAWAIGLFSWASTEGQVEGKAWSLSTLIDEAVEEVIGWVKSLFLWSTEPVKPEDSWIKKIVHDAVDLVITWAKSLFAWANTDEVTDPAGFSISGIVKEAIKKVVDWATGLFTWARAAGTIEGEEGEEKWSLITMIDAAIKKVVKWATGLFTWAKKEGTDEEGEFSLTKLVGKVVNKIKQYFWNDDGKSGILQFDLAGALPDFDLKGMFAGIGDMFSIDAILGGIGRKLEAQDWTWKGEWLKNIMLKVFDPTKGLDVDANAMGGTFGARRPFMAGELGPEMIFPNSAGQVMNAQRTDAMRDSMIQRRLDGMGGVGGQPIIAPTTVANTQSTNITHTTTSLINPDLVISTVNKAA